MRILLVLATATLLAACGQDADTDPAPVTSDLPKLRVVTSGGFSSAYNILAPRFEAATRIEIDTEYGASTGGAPDSIPERLKRGEQFDVLILSRTSLDQLTEAGHVVADSRTDVARSLIGMAVAEGAPVPDISTSEKFIEALLAVDSIGYSASISGTYLSTDLLPRIGIWEQIESKSLRIESERVAAVVARGDVAVGFQQVSEILAVDGAILVGPIPDEYQKETTFSAGVTTNTRYPEAAARLVSYLAWVGVSDVVRRVGLEPAATAP